MQPEVKAPLPGSERPSRPAPPTPRPVVPAPPAPSQTPRTFWLTEKNLFTLAAVVVGIVALELARMFVLIPHPAVVLLLLVWALAWTGGWRRATLTAAVVLAYLVWDLAVLRYQREHLSLLFGVVVGLPTVIALAEWMRQGTPATVSRFRHTFESLTADRDTPAPTARPPSTRPDAEAHVQALQEQLRLREDQLRAIGDGFPDQATVVLDPEGRVRSWNDAAARLHGWPGHDILGRDFGGLYAPTSTAGRSPMELLSAAAQGRFDGECVLQRADATPVTARVVVTAWRDEQGRIGAYHHHARQVSRPAPANGEALRQRADQLVFLVGALGKIALRSYDLDTLMTQVVNWVALLLGTDFVAILEFSADRRELILRAQRGWGDDALGRKHAEAGPGSFAERLLQHPEEPVITHLPTQSQFSLPSAWKDQRVESCAAVLVSGADTAAPSGMLVTHSATAREFDGNDVLLLEALAGILATAQARRKDELDKERMQGLLRQAEKMEAIGQLAAGVAHDFNNLLTIMQGHVARLMAGSPASAQVEPLRQVFEATERAASMTRQLLAFSRRQVLQPRVLDLREVVNSMTRLLGRLLGAHLKLRVENAATLPPVLADPSMIEQIILNLAVNARDAMPRGGDLVIGTAEVVVEAAHLERQPQARAGRFVSLRVTDTGCGIEPAILERIWEPFFTTKEVGKGTGLGLATVFGIVQQHQGWIEVESAVGQGTTFTVFLPASEQAIPVAAPEPAPTAGASTSGNETILVVEDEPVLRELARAVLQDSGYRVLEATSGEEALVLWEKQGGAVHLLLTDMMLPGGIPGRDLAEKLRAREPKLKVIYTTGYSADTMEVGANVVEGVNFLQKPYAPPKLAQTVRACLDAPAPPSDR